MFHYLNKCKNENIQKKNGSGKDSSFEKKRNKIYPNRRLFRIYGLLGQNKNPKAMFRVEISFKLLSRAINSNNNKPECLDK